MAQEEVVQETPAPETVQETPITGESYDPANVETEEEKKQREEVWTGKHGNQKPFLLQTDRCDILRCAYMRLSFSAELARSSLKLINCIDWKLIWFRRSFNSNGRLLIGITPLNGQDIRSISISLPQTMQSVFLKT